MDMIKSSIEIFKINVFKNHNRVGHDSSCLVIPFTLETEVGESQEKVNVRPYLKKTKKKKSLGA
jgi:hypothetical protein